MPTIVEIPGQGEVEFPDDMSDTDIADAIRKNSKPAVTANDRGLAATSGGYSGVADMLGLPVDTALNVWDLGKAGLGTIQGLATGKTPSSAFDPSERSNYPGSSAWVKQQLNKAGAVTEAPRPDDRASRYLHLGSEIGTAAFLGSRLPAPERQPPVAPKEGWTMPGYGPRDLAKANSSANANVNVGAGQAAAESTAGGALNVSARGGGSTFGAVGDDAATGLTRGQDLARLGFQQGKLTPGQATGNKLLQRLEAKLESQPMTAGPFDKIKNSNLREVNKAAAKAIGENADNLSPDVLDRAVTRIGGVFDDVRDKVPRSIDPKEFVAKMQGVGDEFEAIGPQVWKHPLVSRLVAHAESGTATGKDLGSLSSKLGREVYRQMTSPSGDREMGMALGRIKDYVDDLVEQGLSGGKLADYQAARSQYRNLQLLTSRVGTINSSTGNVNGSALANVLQQTDKKGFLFGRNKSDLYSAARFSQAFKPIVGDSGTATRMPLQGPMDFVVGLPFNLATRAYTSSPSVNAAVAAQSAARSAGGLLQPLAPDLGPGGLLGAGYEAGR